MWHLPEKKLQPVVWDPFVGCGSTAVAAMKMEKVTFVGGDIDDEAVQVCSHIISSL